MGKIKCAICGLGIAECLQAAHITPYNAASREQRISHKNGLLLCANHHLLFDRHQITISPEGIVLYRSSTPNGSQSELDHTATTQLNGKRAFLPQNERYRPDISALTSHHSIFASKAKK
jgi:putative restriction endonuclease